MNDKKKWTGERWETFVHNETALEHLHRYALACEFSAGKTVLDIACGEGYGSYLLAGNALAVTGVDIDEPTIKAATRKYKADHLTYLTADASATPLPAHSYDLLVSFETLEHLADHERLLDEFKRLLKADGQLIISTPDKEMYSDKTGYRNPFHKKELNRLEFELLLQKYFNHVRILTQETCHSSLIINNGQSRFDIYTGDQQQLEKNNTPTGLYLVAIAADEALPEINSSVFNGRSILQQALEEQERLLRQTVSYRVGHLLLSPFKWFKKLFQ